MLLNFVALFLPLSALLMSPTPYGGEEENISVPMEIENIDENWFFMGFLFEEKYVRPVLKKKGVKLPEVLGSSDRVGITFDGVPLISRQGEDGTRLLTLDVNNNNDLTDDDAVRIAADGSARVSLLRTYASDGAKPAWLPYLVRYQRSERDGENIEHFFMTTLYKAKGFFTFKGEEYYLSLEDMDCNGRFDREDLTGGSALNVGVKGEPLTQKNIFYGFQFIPLGDDFFTISDLAEDGSRVELARSPLHPYKLGEPAPEIPLADMAGETFHLNDYKGKVVLLNFWDSG